MPNPKKDMNSKQWDRVESEIGRRIVDPKHRNDTDRNIALHALNTVFGKSKENEDGVEYIQPPSGGYTQELIDGVMSVIPVRRRQLVG